MADNSVTMVGNITREPELRFTGGGKGVASFGVAVNRRYQVNGEWQEKVSFFNIVAWDSLGENAAASLHKGTRIIVTGRLEQRDYETTRGREAHRRRDHRRRDRAVACAGPVPRSSASPRDGHGRPAAGPLRSSLRSGGGRAPDPVYGDEEPF